MHWPESARMMRGHAETPTSARLRQWSRTTSLQRPFAWPHAPSRPLLLFPSRRDESPSAPHRTATHPATPPGAGVRFRDRLWLFVVARPYRWWGAALLHSEAAA